MTTPAPFVSLIRRYVIDYLACGDMSVCDEIMHPDFLLYMGGHELGPRDKVYVPAVAKQMEQFPGLCMTANEVMCNGDRLALRFSQHGSSLRHDGQRAAWSGIGLYFWDGERLTANWALEDYYARRRQLASHSTNQLEPPAVAPWDEVAEPIHEANEATITAWLEAGSIYDAAGVSFDDEWNGHESGPIIEVSETTIDDLFSAGDRVAFHMTQKGSYLGGAEKPARSGGAEKPARSGGAEKPDRVGESATLRSAGIVTISDGVVVAGRVIRDRSGLFA